MLFVSSFVRPSVSPLIAVRFAIRSKTNTCSEQHCPGRRRHRALATSAERGQTLDHPAPLALPKGRPRVGGSARRLTASGRITRPDYPRRGRGRAAFAAKTDATPAIRAPVRLSHSVLVFRARDRRRAAARSPLARGGTGCAQRLTPRAHPARLAAGVVGARPDGTRPTPGAPAIFPHLSGRRPNMEAPPQAALIMSAGAVAACLLFQDDVG